MLEMKGSHDEFIKMSRKLQMTLGLRLQRSLTIPDSLHPLRPIWSTVAERWVALQMEAAGV
jgi:hypothetical protein